MVLPPQELKIFLDKHDRFIVAGHSEPDGDCLCSSIALASILNRYGKEAMAYNEGPFTRSDINGYDEMVETQIREDWFQSDQNTALIIVDCSTPERTGSLSDKLATLPTAVIDHHASGEAFGNVRYIDINSPSTTLLVSRVASMLALPLTEDEASQLFFGFCTDTGYFRHLSYRRHHELCEAAGLMQAGADPKKAHQQMTGGKSRESRILLGRLLSRLEFSEAGDIIFLYDTQSDIEELGAEARDADALYGQLFSIAGVEAVVYIKYREPDSYSVGLRSLSRINVGAIAAELGGGGHRLASGLKYSGNFDTLKNELMSRIVEERFLLT